MSLMDGLVLKVCCLSLFEHFLNINVASLDLASSDATGNATAAALSPMF